MDALGENERRAGRMFQRKRGRKGTAILRPKPAAHARSCKRNHTWLPCGRSVSISSTESLVESPFLLCVGKGRGGAKRCQNPQARNAMHKPASDCATQSSHQSQAHEQTGKDLTTYPEAIGTWAADRVRRVTRSCVWGVSAEASAPPLRERDRVEMPELAVLGADSAPDLRSDAVVVVVAERELGLAGVLSLVLLLLLRDLPLSVLRGAV